MESIPFYANTSDDTHCFQAAVRMILKHFLPDHEFNWDTLDELSGKRPNQATWPQQMLLSLGRLGFEATMVEGFDGEAFVSDGIDYLKRTFGDEMADYNAKNSDIPAEQRIYQELLSSPLAIVENRIPKLTDMSTYLQKGYLSICNVNARKLHNIPGYSGHFVVVYDVSEGHVSLHDPGLPPRPNLTISSSEFETAWANPNEYAKNFIAIRPAALV